MLELAEHLSIASRCVTIIAFQELVHIQLNVSKEGLATWQMSSEDERKWELI
jgi:hypothetical protein